MQLSTFDDYEVAPTVRTAVPSNVTDPSLVLGYTNDRRPCIFLAIGSERCTLSLTETSRLTNNLRGLVRKIRRATWKEAAGNE